MYANVNSRHRFENTGAVFYAGIAAVGHKVACGQPGYAGGFKYLSPQTKIFTNNMLNFPEFFTTILITMISENEGK